MSERQPKAQQGAVQAAGTIRFPGSLPYSFIIDRETEDAISALCRELGCDRHTGALKLMRLGSLAYAHRRAIQAAEKTAITAIAHGLENVDGDSSHE